MQYTCPQFFKYIVNTYRKPAELHVANSGEMIYSEEGTTQGDTSAMPMYACSLMPLVEETKCVQAKQIFYADDGAGAGKIDSVVEWWGKVKDHGPKYGYFPKPSKSWLIVKPQYYEEALAKFPDVNVTDKGHRYLGSYIGCQEGVEGFIHEEMKSWREDVEGLCKIAMSEPQLAYSAFIYGTSKRWNFVARTTPDISEFLRPLEYQIKEEFMPAVVGKQFIPDKLRDLFSLPARMGGLGINDIHCMLYTALCAVYNNRSQ